jgi:hypothetical protein
VCDDAKEAASRVARAHKALKRDVERVGQGFGWRCSSCKVVDKERQTAMMALSSDDEKLHVSDKKMCARATEEE